MNKLLDSLDNFRIWGLRCVCIGAREDNTRVYARPTPRGINAEVWSDCAAGVGENRFPFQFEPRPIQNLLGSTPRACEVEKEKVVNINVKLQGVEGG